jgi:hypothetical protein
LGAIDFVGVEAATVETGYGIAALPLGFCAAELGTVFSGLRLFCAAIAGLASLAEIDRISGHGGDIPRDGMVAKFNWKRKTATSWCRRKPFQ